jgi:hypothetical protein
MNDDRTFPNTFRVQDTPSNTGRPRLFDPALKHFLDAYQLGDYVSGTPEERAELERARREVRNHLLQLVATSRWRDHLVLRGSVLMQWWFEERARDPKDIDWVFQPADVGPSDLLAKDFLNDFTELVRQNPRTPITEIVVSKIAQDSIWTYERAEGRRLLFPFQINGGRMREIQMDIVWRESLPEPPTLVSLPENDSAESKSQLWAATPALSLAWKLLWLATDNYPQGKDYYDAVLLAEKLKAEGTPLLLDLLQKVFNQAPFQAMYNPSVESVLDILKKQGREMPPDILQDVVDQVSQNRTRTLSLETLLQGQEIDWDDFKRAYPWIEVNAEEWERRLASALAPTFGK